LTTQPSQFINLPGLFSQQLEKDFCLLSSGQKISRADFFAHALSLSQQLPAQTYAINLCQDRYLFMVAYLAVLLRQQITLLPANQATKTIARLLTTYQHSYCLSDIKTADNRTFIVDWDLLTQFSNADLTGFKNLSGLNEKPFPRINIHDTVSISFTSGSTGEPKAISKTWAEFQQAAELALTAVGLQNKAFTLVSTVPPQHMYGLETSLFWVLYSDLTIHNSRPFYPEDIRKTLQSLPQSVFVSTPTHLKSCVHSQGHWDFVRQVLSSTAPLAAELAKQIEHCFHAPLLEIYGSTETLSFATRRTAFDLFWRTYQGITLYQQQQQFFVSGGHLTEPVELHDYFDISDTGLFNYLGRSTDVIKIAGKRASLAELNRILTQLPNVKDGIFFKLKNNRLAAFVVSDAKKHDILAELKTAMDAVFLPRRIYQVAKLPRNETGKIIHSELEQLIQTFNHATN
jgi:acyl-coenzyme A synthetase/AMP-(fatty) acid ligase